MIDDWVRRAGQEGIDVSRFDENPIYPKRRKVPLGSNFKLGDTVTIVSGNSAGLSGTVHRIYNRWDSIWVDLKLGQEGLGWVSAKASDVVVTSRHADNPIYPKGRSTYRPKVGDRVIIARGIGVGIPGRVVQFFNDGQGVVIQAAGGFQHSALTRNLIPDPKRMEENPVYPKGRFPGKFSKGQKVIVHAPHDKWHHGKIGEITAIASKWSEGSDITYEVQFPNWNAVSIIQERYLKDAYEDNPIYPKGRRRMARYYQGAKITALVGGPKNAIIRGRHFNTRQGWWEYDIEIEGAPMPGPLEGTNRSYRITESEGIVNGWEETLKREGKPFYRIEFNNNPIFPKKRVYGKFKIGEKVYVRNYDLFGVVTDIGTSNDVVMYQVETPAHSLWYTEKNLEPSKGSGYTPNPIFPKRRWINDIKVGQRVRVLELKGSAYSVGTVVEIEQGASNLGLQEPTYKVMFNGPAPHFSYYMRVEIEPVYESNPIYPKKRLNEAQGVKVGQRVRIIGPIPPNTGSVGNVVEITHDPFSEVGVVEPVFKVQFQNPKTHFSYYVRHEFDVIREPVKPYESNPIYDKHRPKADLPKFVVGERVKLKHSVSSSGYGRIISVTEYRQIDQGFASTKNRRWTWWYRVEFKDDPLIRVVAEVALESVPSPNPPRRWGTYPADYPSQGEVVIDSHPSSLTHGRTAVILDRRPHRLHGAIYQLKFRDGSTSWRTYLQVRRMPGKLGWRSMQENPVYAKGRGDGFHVGDRVKVISEGLKDYGKRGRIIKLNPLIGMMEYKSYCVVELDNGIKGYYPLRSLEKIAYGENPIYDKKRKLPFDEPKFMIGDHVSVVRVDSAYPHDANIRSRVGRAGIVLKKFFGLVSWQYEVQFSDGFIGTFFQDELGPATYSTNPVYPKGRSDGGFKIGDYVEVNEPGHKAHGRNGKVIRITQTAPNPMIFWVAFYGTEPVEYPFLSRDLRPSSKLMDNPVYDKKRPQFKVGDCVMPIYGTLGGKKVAGDVRQIKKSEDGLTFKYYIAQSDEMGVFYSWFYQDELEPSEKGSC